MNQVIKCFIKRCDYKDTGEPIEPEELIPVRIEITDCHVRVSALSHDDENNHGPGMLIESDLRNGKKLTRMFLWNDERFDETAYFEVGDVPLDDGYREFCVKGANGDVVIHDAIGGTIGEENEDEDD